jgi:hypothetical protein
MGAALILAAVVLAGIPGDTSAQVPEWPVDLELLRSADFYATQSGADTAEEIIEAARRSELALVLAQDLIVVGTVTSTQGHETSPRGEIYTDSTINVESCEKGDCGGGTLTARTIGGTVGDRTLSVVGSGPPGSGPFNTDAPKVGDRGVFLMRRDVHEPSVLWGGTPRCRYVVQNGQVVRKGMLLDDFLALLRAYLQSRTPVALFRASDAVVMGTVKEVVFSHKNPPLEPAPPEGRNFALLEVQDVGKGELLRGMAIRVELPYTAGLDEDWPRFQAGERVVVFLKKTLEGTWEPAAGWDSRVRVPDDGSIVPGQGPAPR